MEYFGTKRGGKRRRNRRFLATKRNVRCKQMNFEVIPEKRQKTDTKDNNFVETFNPTNDMEAKSFWDNYKSAHDWHDRHNVIWWQTRCYALEHEIHILKEKLREVMDTSNPNSSSFSNTQYNQYNSQNLYQNPQNHQSNGIESEEYDTNDEDNIEFEVDETMLEFLAQSARHKEELRLKKEAEEVEETKGKIQRFKLRKVTDKQFPKEPFENIRDKVNRRMEDAKSLYGENSSKILAMETALQATNERHVDKKKPTPWPNIPLKF